MPEPAQQPDPWSLRASDADRDKYLALLGEAYAEGRLDGVEYDERMNQALASKTFRELYPLLVDLPLDPARVPGPPILPTGPATAVEGADHYLPVAAPQNVPAAASPPLDPKVVSVLGSATREGPWQVPPQMTVLSVLGDVTIDLTGAILSGMHTELRCNSVLGSIKVIVPDALHVDVNGTEVLGEFETKDKRKRKNRLRTPAPDAPHVRVIGTAVLGSVEVHTVVPRGGATVSMRNPALPQAPQRPAIEPPPEAS